MMKKTLSELKHSSSSMHSTLADSFVLKKTLAELKHFSPYKHLTLAGSFVLRKTLADLKCSSVEPEQFTYIT